MKNGLFEENGKLVYYVNDKPKHAGVVKIDGDIYYIGSHGYAATGTHVVHSDMANDILRHGTYTFGEDGKLIEGSYLEPIKSKSSKKKKKKKNKKKLKENLKLLIPVGCLALACVLILGVGWVIKYFKGAEDTPNSGETEVSVSISLPEFSGEEVLLCSKSAKSAYDGECRVSDAVSSGNPYRPFEYKYNIGTETGMLEIGENENLSDSKQYVIGGGETVLKIDNLKTGTKYYYKVTVDEKEYPGTFVTAQSTRFVSIPGVENARDIGGYVTEDGKKVRQGMIIRGSEIDGLVEPKYYLRDDDVGLVQKIFGFGYEFDLREKNLFIGNYQSRLGKDVGHKFYAAPYYGNIFSHENKDELKVIFSDLASPDNYPMYLHCTSGADRTGTVCFLLEGVLNCSPKTMQYDYQLSGFSKSSYADNESYNAITSGLESYKGNTIQEKIVDFLIKEIGVTEKEIESIRNIMLED